MRCAHALVPLFATLALAACGEEQTATAPATPPPATTATERPAAPPVTTTTAPPAATTAPPASTAAIPSTTGAAGATATGGVTATPATSGAPPAANPPSSQSAAAAPANLQPFQGRSYSAGPVTVRLNPDNTFEMNETDGTKKVTGRYNYENGIVRFSEPQGDVGGAQFPMQCRFEPAGTSEFRLTDNSGSCTRFKDLTFKPAAG